MFELKVWLQQQQVWILAGMDTYGGRELPLKILKFVGIIFVIFFLILIYYLFFFLK